MQLRRAALWSDVVRDVGVIPSGHGYNGANCTIAERWVSGGSGGGRNIMCRIGSANLLRSLNWNHNHSDAAI